MIDNQNNIRHEERKHFRNIKMEYLKDIIKELAMNSINKNIYNCKEEKLTASAV
jgi:hypothetical protein